LFKIHHQIITFQASFNDFANFSSSLSFGHLSEKIISIHIIDTLFLLRFLITGIYSFLGNGNSHIFSRLSSSIVTTIISLDTFRFSATNSLYNLSDKLLSILIKSIEKR
jgi:hypothetical protein